MSSKLPSADNKRKIRAYTLLEILPKRQETTLFTGLEVMFFASIYTVLFQFPHLWLVWSATENKSDNMRLLAFSWVIPAVLIAQQRKFLLRFCPSSMNFSVRRFVCHDDVIQISCFSWLVSLSLNVVCICIWI